MMIIWKFDDVTRYVSISELDHSRTSRNTQHISEQTQQTEIRLAPKHFFQRNKMMEQRLGHAPLTSETPDRPIGRSSGGLSS